MSNAPSVKKNYIWNTSYQILTLIVPLITAPYIARVIGADGNGVYSYTRSILSYFTLIAVLGTTLYGQRNIAYVRKSKENVSKTFWEIWIFRITTTALTTVAYFFFVSTVSRYRILYYIYLVDLINVVTDISWFYQGIEDFQKIVVRNFIMKACQTASIFLFVKQPSDLWIYALSTSGFTLLGNISMWFPLPHYIQKVKGIHPYRHLKDIILLFLPTIASQVYVVLDKSMIGWITDSSYQNGCYEQAEKIARMALTVITSLATVVLPRVANLFKEGHTVEAKEYIYKGYRFTFMLSIPIMFGLIGITKIFVPVFFGPGYDLVNVLLPIFSILVVAVSLSYITGYSYLITTGQQNIYTLAVTIAAACNLCMNSILIPRIGATGAAIASVTAEIVGVVIQVFYCHWKRQLQLSKILDSVWKYLFAGICMLIFLLLLTRVLQKSILSLVILIIGGAIVYYCILLILKDSYIKEYSQKAINKIKAIFHR